MTLTLHDLVSQRIAESVWNCGNDCVRHGADAHAAASVAIRTVIEALAREAEDATVELWPPARIRPDGEAVYFAEDRKEMPLADWLRAHCESHIPLEDDREGISGAGRLR